MRGSGQFCQYRRGGVAECRQRSLAQPDEHARALADQISSSRSRLRLEADHHSSSLAPPFTGAAGVQLVSPPLVRYAAIGLGTPAAKQTIDQRCCWKIQSRRASMVYATRQVFRCSLVSEPLAGSTVPGMNDA